MTCLTEAEFSTSKFSVFDQKFMHLQGHDHPKGQYVNIHQLRIVEQFFRLRECPKMRSHL